MLSHALALAEPALAAETPHAASQAFFAAASAAMGASYLQTRVYRKPSGALTSERHWAAGGVVARHAPAGWPGSTAFRYVCFECNPLLGAIRGGLTRYRFSDFAPRGARPYARYWDAMSEAGIADALCATSYGPGRAVASVHLGFGDRAFTAAEAQGVHMAGLLLTERLLQLGRPAEEPPVRLTARERDAMAFAADGKSDWEISAILGVSEATARFHVDNARRKLGAVNRTQAVARMATEGLL